MSSNVKGRHTVLRLNFLGEQRVSVEGAADSSPLVVGRALEILAYLVVNAGMPQERERLAGMFWPESSSSQSRTNLRRELHALRQLPGMDGHLENSGTSVLWHDGPGCVSDVRDFHRNRARALGRAAEGEQAGLVRCAWAAVEEYKGDFLPGMYQEWVLSEREILRRLCVELCDKVAESTDEPGLAIAAAQRRLRLEPLEETGYQTLMRLQAAAGDSAATVRTYHRCAAILENELGVEPGAQTRNLARRLLGFTPSRRPSDGRAVMALREGPAAGSPVGRELEQQGMADRWGQARAGRPGLLLLTGDAGLGKTRLLVALLAAAKSQGAITAYARCFAGAGRIAMAPVAGWLESNDFRGVAGTQASPWSGELARLLSKHGPAVGGNSSAAGPASVAPGDRNDVQSGGLGSALADAGRRRAFHEGMVRAVLAPDRPTLLILDDLQWCDEETIEWMAVLFTVAPSAKLLVAAGARMDELAARTSAMQGLNALRNGRWVQEMSLEPLDAKSSAELATSVLDRALDPGEVDLLHAATGGYPLHVVEAARGMERPGGDGAVGESPIGAGGRGLSLAEVLAGSANGPGVLRRRLEQCSEPARSVASLAAAVGREFSLDLLARAWTGDVQSLVRAVDELWRRRILREQRGGYDFSHDLLRQSAYELLSPPQQWLQHHRLAQALEQRNPGSKDAVAAQLAEQYRRAGDTKAAMGYFVQAGDVATRIFANARAVADYQSGLDLLAEQPPDETTQDTELDVLLRMPPSLTALRGYSSPQLRATLERIIELAENLGRSRVLASALIGLFAATFVQGQTALSHSVATRALDLAKGMPDLLGQANFAVGGAATSLGRTDEAISHFDLACAQAPDAHSYILGTRIEVHGRAWSSHAHWLAGDDDGAVALAVEATDRATLADHPYSLAVALGYRAMLLQMRLGGGGLDDGSAADTLVGADSESRDELAEVAAQLEALCARYSFAYYGQWGAIWRGWIAGGEGGVATIKKALGDLRAASALARMPYWLSLLANTQLSCGLVEEARSVLASAESAAYQRDDLWWLPEVLRQQALLEETTSARALLARALSLAGKQHSTQLAARVVASVGKL